MKTKRNKAYYLQRAITGFKALIIYQCVTKPQFDPVYKDANGKFSKDKMFEEVNFFKRWAKMGSYERNRYAKLHAKYSKHHNLAFGLDCRLVEQILGCFRNDEGKKERISIKDVANKLYDAGWLDWHDHGTTTKKNEQGKAEVVCWWKRKYFIKNRDYWLRLLADPRFSNYAKYPLDDEGFTIRAIEIIAKYRRQTIVKHYPDEIELVKDFTKGNIDELVFRSVAKRQFKIASAEIDAVISRKRGMTNGNPETKENQTRTHNQDKQGKAVSDETPSPAESSNNSAPSGQGEKPICLGGSLQEAQGLQKTAN